MLAQAREPSCFHITSANWEECQIYRSIFLSLVAWFKWGAYLKCHMFCKGSWHATPTKRKVLKSLAPFFGTFMCLGSQNYKNLRNFCLTALPIVRCQSFPRLSPLWSICFCERLDQPPDKISRKENSLHVYHNYFSSLLSSPH